MIIQPWETDPASVAYEFMTAGGMNEPHHIDALIAGRPIADAAAEFAVEAAENWNLQISVSDLERAIVDFLTTRPDRY